MSKKKEEVKTEEVEAPLGLVLYTDGGARPNPGPAGWGMHGYLFRAEKPKRGTGNPEHVVTTHGYVLKTDYKDIMEGLQQKDWDATMAGKRKSPLEVTPVHYVDGYGAFDHMVSNNVAELVAATRGFVYAAEHNVKYVRIYTDSEYVRNGIEKWIYGWQRNGWVKGTGEPVANQEYWKELVAARDALHNRAVYVEVSWVKGHDDHLGNETADTYATVAVMISKRLVMRQPVHLPQNQIATAPAEGYWKYVPDRHPFLSNTKMYYNTQSDYLKPGEYYLGEHEDDDTAGKRNAEGAFALVRLAEPVPVLETIRNHQCMMADNSASLMYARLDQLYKPNIHKQMEEYGDLTLVRSDPRRLDLQTIKDQPLTKEFKPAKIAMRVVESIEILSNRLEEYLAGHPNIVVTDLTPILYERSVKEGKKGADPKEIMTLKPEYNVGYAALHVQANYQDGENIAQVPVILSLSIDMPNRNALKRLEEFLPKISLISWLESPKVFRYATVIEAGADKGIWAGVYSNVRMVV